jgi:hypothetical protein
LNAGKERGFAAEGVGSGYLLVGWEKEWRISKDSIREKGKDAAPGNWWNMDFA